MSIKQVTSCSFFAHQDVAIEVLSFLEPRSLAQVLTTHKAFFEIRNEAFRVFLSTSTGMVSLNQCEQFARRSLKRVMDWGTICNEMGPGFSVKVDLNLSSETQFRLFLTSNSLGKLARLLIRDKSTLTPSARSIVNNPELQTLVKYATTLTHLELHDSTVTDVGISHLRNLKLVSLSLTRCKRVTNRAANDIAKMSHLTELNLHGCFGITGDGLRAILQTVKTLRKIDISSHNVLPDDSYDNGMAQALADNGQQLTHIAIDGSKCHFERKSAIIKNGLNLTFFSARWCAIGLLGIKILQNLNPRLNLVTSDSGIPIDDGCEILMSNPGPTMQFEHESGGWKLSDLGPEVVLCCQLRMKSVDEDSLVQRFEFLGYNDQSVLLKVDFNQDVLKQCTTALKRPRLQGKSLLTTSNAELQKVSWALFLSSEIPDPYKSLIIKILDEQDLHHQNLTLKSKA